MKTFIHLLALLALCSVPLLGQEASFESAVLLLSGASQLEDLDESELERYHDLASRPLRINLSPESKLSASGLLSRYQAASLRDYITHHGDVLSSSELALVDGFGAEAARALEPFVSFETASTAGRASLDSARIVTESLARASAKRTEGTSSAAYALKLRTGDAERWELAFAAKSAYSDPLWPPESLSGSAVWYGRRHLSKVVLGDFNTRFGQGLLLWSGFSLSGFSSASFARHPSGVSAAWTLSPSMTSRGAAVELGFGRTALSLCWDLDDGAAANLTHFSSISQVGVTAVQRGAASADWRVSLGKWDLYGEAAADYPSRSLAGVAGITFNPAWQTRISALLRAYPEGWDDSRAGGPRSATHTADERGAALALDCKSLTFVADAALHPAKDNSQYKALLKYAPQVGDWLTIGLRLSSRYRPKDSSPLRVEARAESSVSYRGLSVKGCADLCRCEASAWLFYVEPGLEREAGRATLKAFLRGTAFKVDKWNDRIYMYERDLPGAFSVPAYYGRGWSLSAVASCKWRKCSLGVRASCIQYPGMSEKKPGKAELKFQLQTKL